MAEAWRDVVLADEPVRLFADRALLWPRRNLLVIADLHLGKADHFRRAGIALPRGGTAHDLARLDALLDATSATGLLVLGDLLHAGTPDAAWVAQWQAWRARRMDLSVSVVAGNHDRALTARPARADALALTLHDAWLALPPFLFGHDVATRPQDAPGYALGGHLHPVVRLPGLPRLPAFQLGPRAGLLPAFTAFAGGVPVQPGPGDRLFACAPGALVELPPG